MQLDKVILPSNMRPLVVSALRYIGDILGWSLVQIADDLKDWFYQFRLHASEFECWKSTFVFKRAGGQLKYYQETVMGMGCYHTSNIAQRFSNTLVIAWYAEFARLDEAFMQQEVARNSKLRAWLEHRVCLPANATEQKQDGLHSAHAFTDDFHASILEPPHHSRLATGITAWHNVTLKYRVLTAAPRKRAVGLGASITWTGVIVLSCLALIALPQDKVIRALHWLVEAAAQTPSLQS